MTAQSKTVIKSYFETGDYPTQDQFADLIDSYQNASNALDSVSAVVSAATSAQLIATNGGSLIQLLTPSAATSLINAISNDLVDAKGDLITATANNTPARLPAGSNGQDLLPSSSASTGLIWQDRSDGFRNRIINGSMYIDQRNAGSFATITFGGQYTLDRWSFNVSQSSKITSQQSLTTPVGAIYSLLVTSLSSYAVLSSDYFSLDQNIEGTNIQDLAWGSANAATCTLSFSVFSTLTGTFGGSIANSAGNRSYPFTYTINAANTWESKTITIPGDTTGTWLTTVGVGIRIHFGLGVGSNFSGTAGTWATATYISATGATSVVGTSGALFNISKVQFEKGSVATAFEYRPFGTELALCQRYYEKSFNYATAPAQNAGNAGATAWTQAVGASAGTNVGWATFLLRKRAVPTVTLYNPQATNAQVRNASGSDCSASAVNQTQGEVGFSVGATTPSATAAGSQLLVHWTAEAEL